MAGLLECPNCGEEYPAVQCRWRCPMCGMKDTCCDGDALPVGKSPLRKFRDWDE
jgi:Zn finger protein HypA/HybF involved in hydrogenase expression